MHYTEPIEADHEVLVYKNVQQHICDMQFNAAAVALKS